MPEKQLDMLSLLLYAIVAASGALGACATASASLLRRRQMALPMFMAYVLIGVVFSMLALAFGSALGVQMTTIDEVIGKGLIVGSVSSATLAGCNLSMRWWLKRLGVEIEVSVRRRDDE